MVFNNTNSYLIVALGYMSNMGPTRLESRCWQGCTLHRRLWGRVPHKFMQLLLNSIPRGCRTEALVSLLAVSRGWPAAGRSQLPSSFYKSSNRKSSPHLRFGFPFGLLSYASSAVSLLLVGLPSSSFKGSGDYIGPTWIIQAIPFTFRSAD